MEGPASPQTCLSFDQWIPQWIRLPRPILAVVDQLRAQLFKASQKHNYLPGSNPSYLSSLYGSKTSLLAITPSVFLFRTRAPIFPRHLGI